MRQDVTRCDKTLRRLETKFEVVIEISFLSKMGDK